MAKLYFGVKLAKLYLLEYSYGTPQRAFERPCGCLGSHGDAAPFIGAIVSAGGYAGLCDHRAPVRLARQGSTRRLLKHALIV
jgi:hypothetical protein